MTTYEVNEHGLDQIRNILAEYSKYWRGERLADIPNEAVYAYAEDAENGMNENGDACFEIRASHSVTGNPMVFSINDNGLDAMEVEV